jgi:hypothetical protein
MARLPLIAQEKNKYSNQFFITGSSGAPVPNLSIEVDGIDTVLGESSKISS